MHQFYQPDLDQDYVLLEEDESKHAIRVLRLRLNDEVELVNGLGLRCRAIVVDEHPKHCRLQIIKRAYEKRNRNYYFHLAIAPTKNMDRMEWLIEKATEIGIDRISLMDCDHSERTTVKLERLEKITIAAMKQSQQAYLPGIDPVSSFDDILNDTSADIRCIAHCYAGTKPHLQALVVPGKKIMVLIGPEGDFSENEVKRALDAGFQEISLGENRLRTETAALTAQLCIALKSLGA